MPVGQRATVLFDNAISWGSSWTTADRGNIFKSKRILIKRIGTCKNI